jgi:hypothetical protein
MKNRLDFIFSSRGVFEKANARRARLEVDMQLHVKYQRTQFRASTDEDCETTSRVSLRRA